jgi:hypothetical protein
MKPFYATKEEIPKGLEDFYKEADGKWVLQVEGMVPTTELTSATDRLAEFRSNNITLTQELKTFEGKKFLTQEEQEEFDELKKTADEIKDKGLIDAGKIDELVNSRTERLRTDYDNQIKGLQKQVGDLTTTSNNYQDRLAGVLVEAEVGKVLSAGGFQPVQGALSDVVSRARGTWKVNEKGDLVALDGSGNPVYGTDPTVPLTMVEWAATTVKDAPYLFLENKGTGGDGDDGKGGDKGADGIIRIKRTDEAAKSKHIEEIASGKAIVVD